MDVETYVTGLVDLVRLAEQVCYRVNHAAVHRSTTYNLSVHMLQ